MGKFKFLVADTTAFINKVELNEYAENVFTVPDVVNEVKNKRQIRRLVVLPFDLQVKEPDSEALQFVTHFSKKTGDFASLSSIDLKVIALTYQLEKENCGTKHLRLEPIISKTIASRQKPQELVDNTTLAGFYNPGKTTKEDESESETDPEEVVDEGKGDMEEEEDESDSEDPNELSDALSKLNCDVDSILVPESKDEDQNCEESDTSETDEDEDDDESSWITPSNVAKIKKVFKGDVEEEAQALVACMSTDFAIQNVLKQINLNVAALNGRVIKHLRTYILRCYACFKTTSIITKVFCPNCGNKTLKRVAVSLDENGQQVIHINTRRPLTAKFKNQSIPLPKGGKHSRNPILCEDQPIPKQMPSRVAKTKTNALNEDYIAGFSPFVVRDVDSKSAILRTKGNIKQWARNNLYEEDRRRRSFNRFTKK